MSDYVRPPLNGMQPEAQSLSSLCWYTCFRMLYRWNGRDTSTILDKLTAAGIDIQDARETGLKLKDNLKAAKALEMNCLGFGQPVTVYNLKEVLKHSPVWVTGRWNPASNHVVVLTAASDDWVEYYDPWWVGTPEDVNSVKSAQPTGFLTATEKNVAGLRIPFSGIRSSTGSSSTGPGDYASSRATKAWRAANVSSICWPCS